MVTAEIAITGLRMTDTYHYVFLGFSFRCGTWKDSKQKPTFNLGLRLGLHLCILCLGLVYVTLISCNPPIGLYEI